MIHDLALPAPYVRGGGQGTTASGFWVMPPPEHKPQEYGRPMSIQFTIVQDAFMPKETLLHVVSLTCCLGGVCTLKGSSGFVLKIPIDDCFDVKISWKVKITT